MSNDAQRNVAALPSLASEQVNPASRDLDRRSALDLVRLMNAEDAKVAGAVAAEQARIASAIEGIAGRLRDGGRLIYIGAGTSGRLGALDAAECPPTFNLPPGTVVGCIAGGVLAWDTALEDLEDRADQGEADLERLDVRAADAVVGITASGRTPYVLGAVALAARRGAFTIGLACNADAPLASLVDVMIAPVVGPEILAGSTRLKAGTAQKMVLNMLSTGAMVLLGKTYDGLMVDVQATNAKLRGRAVAMVAHASGVAPDTAAALLQEADGDVKVAILVARAGLAPEAARGRLAAHGNILRAALEAEAE